MSKRPKVFVYTPVYKNIEPEPYFSHLLFHRIIGMGEAAGAYITRTGVKPRTRIQNARNESVGLAISQKADYILFIDDDMILPHKMDLLAHLLSLDKDIVAPLFFRVVVAGKKILGSQPCVYRENSTEADATWLDYPRDCVFECSAIGTGVMLVSTKVFLGMKPPWFYYTRESNRSMDVHFCLDARRAGFTVWCDSRIVVPQQGGPKQIYDGKSGTTM